MSSHARFRAKGRRRVVNRLRRLSFVTGRSARAGPRSLYSGRARADQQVAESVGVGLDRCAASSVSATDLHDAVPFSLLAHSR